MITDTNYNKTTQFFYYGWIVTQHTVNQYILCCMIVMNDNISVREGRASSSSSWISVE